MKHKKAMKAVYSLIIMSDTYSRNGHHSSANLIMYCAIMAYQGAFGEPSIKKWRKIEHKALKNARS